MTPNEFLEALASTTAVKEGGTPHGMSADERALDCGLKAAFSDAAPRLPTVFPIQFFDAKNKPRVVGNRAGTVFHACNELWAGGLEPRELPPGKDFLEVDAAIAAGLNSFARYISWHTAGIHTFGHCLAVEFPFAGQHAGFHRTGRADRVIQADQVHVDSWADLGIFSAEPGLYLWDYKLLKAVTAAAGEKYRDSLQPLAYMAQYEQTTGVRPRGFIFDLVSRAEKPTIARLLVLISNLPQNLRILEDSVKLAEARRAEGAAVAAHCNNQYSPCPFKKVCPRYGTAQEHTTLITQYAAQFSAVEEEVE